MTNIITNVLSGAVGGLAGGESGATSAATADRFNRQLHPDELAWIVGEKDKDGNYVGGHAQEFMDDYNANNPDNPITEDQARRMLVQQALRMVDKWWAEVLPKGNNDAAATFLLSRSMGQIFDDPYVHEVPFFQAPGKLYEYGGHLAENLKNDDYFNAILKYGTADITGNVNEVVPNNPLLDFKWLGGNESAKALDNLSFEERKRVKALMEIYATTSTLGIHNYALLGDIYNQYSLGEGPPREMNEEAYALADRINQIYGSDQAAYIIYNDFNSQMNKQVQEYFVSAWTTAALAKSLGNKSKLSSKDEKKPPLSNSDEKSIRSLEKRIKEHEQKLADFKANPTVRPGMENQPPDVIAKQHQSRINHLQHEIDNFRTQIEGIKNGTR